MHVHGRVRVHVCMCCVRCVRACVRAVCACACCENKNSLLTCRNVNGSACMSPESHLNTEYGPPVVCANMFSRMARAAILFKTKTPINTSTAAKTPSRRKILLAYIYHLTCFFCSG